MSLTAYVRYDNTGRIVPGGPIVTSVKPKVGDWATVNEVLTTTPNYKLRGFIRYIKNGDYVAGSLILQHDVPQDGNWKEVYVLRPTINTTTTTTTIAPFINRIVISNGSLSATNGTYTRSSPSSGFSQVGGTSFIFNATGDGWYINSGSGNAAKNTSTLGTGTWEPWAPGSSSGITAEYSSYICPTTTTTTSTTTTTTTLFAQTVNYASNATNACLNPTGTQNVVGNAVDFCNCTIFTSNGFATLPDGNYVLAYSGNTLDINPLIPSGIPEVFLTSFSPDVIISNVER